MRHLLAALTLAIASSAAFAACEATSEASRSHLVELYTSTGCNSCPPAEQWMTKLGKHPELIGLEFHVDYWDTAQWHDPFSNHAYTARQEALAKRSNNDKIFTPQIWLDGQVWQNWPKGAPPDVSTASPALKIAVDNGETVRVHLDADAVGAKPDYRLYAALSENGLSEKVNGGENKGKTLNNDSVVRAFAGPLALPRADAELKIPAHADASKMSVVAFVQDEHDGSVVQVVRLPLAECKK